MFRYVRDFEDSRDYREFLRDSREVPVKIRGEGFRKEIADAVAKKPVYSKGMWNSLKREGFHLHKAIKKLGAEETKFSNYTKSGAGTCAWATYKENKQLYAVSKYTIPSLGCLVHELGHIYYGDTKTNWMERWFKADAIEVRTDLFTFYVLKNLGLEQETWMNKSLITLRCTLGNTPMPELYKVKKGAEEFLELGV